MEHSNVYVKNLPPEVDDQTLLTLFQPYGAVESCRVMKSKTPQASNYGFVKFLDVSQATMAIEQMNGATVGSTVIEVKFADSDVGQKRHPQKQQTDNLYVKGFPSSWGDDDLKTLFETCGGVSECRVLQAREPERGGVGLVRMASVDEATVAIERFHGQAPPGGVLSMSVQYADTKEEKERKAKRKVTGSARFNPYERPAAPAAPPSAGVMGGLDFSNPGMGAGITGVDPFGGLGFNQGLNPALTPGLNLLGVPGNGGMPQPNGLGFVGDMGMHKNQNASLYIRNLPPEADRLYLYEKFAPHGAIRSVKVLEDEAGQCRGVGFVNYLDHDSALKAIGALNGMKVSEDKELHVSLQTQRPKRSASKYEEQFQ